MLTPKKTYTRTRGSNDESTHVYEHDFGSPAYSVVSPATKLYVSQLVQLPSPHKKAKTENRIIPYDRLLEKYEKQKRLLSRKRANICRLKKQLNNKHKNDKLNPKLFIKKTKFVSKNSKSLVTMQMLHKKRRPWLQNEKKFSYFYIL